MSQTPMISQGPTGTGQQQTPVNHGPGPMNQGPMNYPQGGPGAMPHPPYMNQQPQPAQPGMEQPGFPNRYGSQGQPSQDQQYNQAGYHGGPQGGFGPRPPMMNNDQGFQGYPNQPGQYSKPPISRDMQGGMYSTPNKRYPDNRNDFMSPGKFLSVM